MVPRRTSFRRLCQARARLTHIDGPQPAIPELARSLGMSPFHFIRSFHALFGATPHQYRIAARLAHARRLLADGRWSVTDACMEAGFSSLGNFCSLFQHRFGEAPGAYRRRIAGADLAPGCLALMARLPDRNFREAPQDRARDDARAARSEEHACASS